MKNRIFSLEYEFSRGSSYTIPLLTVHCSDTESYQLIYKLLQIGIDRIVEKLEDSNVYDAGLLPSVAMCKLFREGKTHNDFYIHITSRVCSDIITCPITYEQAKEAIEEYFK